MLLGNKTEADWQLVISDGADTHKQLVIADTHKQPMNSDGMDTHTELISSDGTDTHRTIQQLCERIHQLEAVGLIFSCAC